MPKSTKTPAPERPRIQDTRTQEIVTAVAAWVREGRAQHTPEATARIKAGLPQEALAAMERAGEVPDPWKAIPGCGAFSWPPALWQGVVIGSYVRTPTPGTPFTIKKDVLPLLIGYGMTIARYPDPTGFAIARQYGNVEACSPEETLSVLLQQVHMRAQGEVWWDPRLGTLNPTYSTNERLPLEDRVAHWAHRLTGQPLDSLLREHACEEIRGAAARRGMTPERVAHAVVSATQPLWRQKRMGYVVRPPVDHICPEAVELLLLMPCDAPQKAEAPARKPAPPPPQTAPVAATKASPQEGGAPRAPKEPPAVQVTKTPPAGTEWLTDDAPRPF